MCGIMAFGRICMLVLEATKDTPNERLLGNELQPAICTG